MKYIIYPEAYKILNNSGLTKRINDYFNSKQKETFYGHIYGDEIRQYFEEMIKEGFFKKCPSNIKEFLNRNVLAAQRDEMESLRWQINGEEHRIDGNENLVQLLLLGGYYASKVLTPDEIWDYQKFGFNNETELVGVIGVILFDNEKYKNCYSYTSKYVNGDVLKTEINEGPEKDFSTTQINMTSLNTIDPLGNIVKYRPIRHKDFFGLHAGHTIELYFLNCLLKFHKQQKIQSKLLGQHERIFEELSKEGFLFSTGKDYIAIPEHELKTVFIDFDKYPLLPFNEKTYFLESRFFIGGDLSYRAWLNEYDELIFHSHEKKRTVLRIQESDFDEILKSLYLQSLKGYGRTPNKHIRQGIDYYLNEFV